MKTKLIIAAIFLALCPSVLAQQPTPRFRNYPARPYVGRNAPARINDRGTRMFRTRLQWASKNQKANFAGDQILTTWGCGTSCIMFALVNARTGKVYFPDFSVQSSGDDPLGFRGDSQLLVVNGTRNEDDDEGVFYYRWDGRKLLLLREVREP